MCGFLKSSSSSPPPAPVLPPPPPPQEILDVIDEVSGTKIVTANDPVTGKKIRLIQALPRSVEEQALYEEAGRLMDTAIGELKRLYDYDPKQLIDFKPFIDTINTLNQERREDMQKLTQIPDFSAYVEDFKAMQRSVLEQEFETAAHQWEARLATTGYSDSTYAAQMKAALSKEKAKTLQQADVEALAYAQSLQERDLARRSQEYNLRETTREGRMASARDIYALQKDYLADLEHQRDKALSHQTQLFNIASGIRSADTNKKMSTMAPNLALAEYQAKNNTALNYYNADINRLTNQYKMDLANYNAKPPGFEQALMSGAGMVAGGFLGGPSGAMAGGQAGTLMSGRR